MSKIIGANANIGGSIRKGAWTGEEDNLLRNCIHKHGEGHWHRVPRIAGLNRCRKSCRLRWFNYLKPNIKRGQFSEDEVDLIIRLHKLLGNKWTLIAGRIPGRTANDVKNYWNTHLRKKLSPLSLPPKHPNTFSGPKSKNNTMHMHPQIIRPRPLVLRKMSPLVINKPDPLSSLCQSNGLENGATKLTVSRGHLVEEEEEDDKDDGKAKWWENMFEVYENGENEEGIIGLQQYNGPIDGLGYQKPTSSIQVQELNVSEEDNLWNFFDVNMWE